MSDPLTPEERAAIAAYRGPVTVCPPHTFSSDLPQMFGRWKVSAGAGGTAGQRLAHRLRKTARSQEIARLARDGYAPAEIALRLEMPEKQVRSILRGLRALEVVT